MAAAFRAGVAAPLQRRGTAATPLQRRSIASGRGSDRRQYRRRSETRRNPMYTLKRLSSSYASVAATVALVLALGMGGAYAAGKIGAKKIAKGAVSSKHIKDGQIKGVDL